MGKGVLFSPSGDALALALPRPMLPSALFCSCSPPAGATFNPRGESIQHNGGVLSVTSSSHTIRLRKIEQTRTEDGSREQLTRTLGHATWWCRALQPHTFCATAGAVAKSECKSEIPLRRRRKEEVISHVLLIFRSHSSLVPRIVFPLQ